jgi:PHD/YefM family antitoxin component YafN of YafNO toxin-antitoxin module
MTKIISAEILGESLNRLLDALKQGETHFLIERGEETVGVLLSVEKFNEIMQMLETLNSLEYFPTDEFESYAPDMPPLSGFHLVEDDKSAGGEKGKRSSEEIREDAARLGIHIIK